MVIECRGCGEAGGRRRGPGGRLVAPDAQKTPTEAPRARLHRRGPAAAPGLPTGDGAQSGDGGGEHGHRRTADARARQDGRTPLVD